MLSPAKKHYQSKQSGQESNAAAANGTVNTGNEYDLMLMQLAEHKRQLKAIQSVQAKIELKRTLLSDYDAYVTGILASASGVADDVLMTVMVWRIDTGDFNGALDIAEYALDHQLPMPEQYRRDTATLVTEEIATAGIEAATDLDTFTLLRVSKLTEAKDMPDEVRAKLEKALGLSFVELGDDEQALNHFGLADKLNKKVGVRKIMEQAHRRLKNADSSAQG